MGHHEPACGGGRTRGKPHSADEIGRPALRAQILDERRNSQKQEGDDEEPNGAHSPHHRHWHVGHLHHVRCALIDPRIVPQRGRMISVIWRMLILAYARPQ